MLVFVCVTDCCVGFHLIIKAHTWQSVSFFLILLKYFLDLPQHFLGDTAVTLPRVYQHSCFAQGDLEHILRACLLDPTFYGLVEKVEGELRKLVEE